MRYTGVEELYPLVHRYILSVAYTSIVMWHWQPGDIDFRGEFIENEIRLRTSLFSVGRIVTVAIALILIHIIFRLGYRVG